MVAMSFMRIVRRPPVLILGACFIILLLLWLPSLQYPIVSDTAIYALLGESMWTNNTYTLFGGPYAKHLPLHAFLSYPFVWALGYSIGMKVSSLLAGWGVLLATYLLLKKTISKEVALVSVVLLTFHHGFVLMVALGSADLLFTMFFLLSVVSYVTAGRDSRGYFFAFVFAGLASLTRYNGVPLFMLFVGHTLLFRRQDLGSKHYRIGLGLGLGLIGAWFLRNFLVFGDPFYTTYTLELSNQSPGFVAQVLSNAKFYMHPARNLLPILLLGSIIGLWKYGKTHGFLVFAMLTAWVLTSFWWVQGMRFAFPGYPILMGFAVLGLFGVCRSRKWLASTIIVLIIITHLPALCLYSSGSCNSWFDRSIGGIPPDLGLSSEGFYTWDIARDYINEHAEPEAYVNATLSLLSEVWQHGVFRDDLNVVENIYDVCPAYQISADSEGGEVLYVTEDAPHRYVHLFRCR